MKLLKYKIVKILVLSILLLGGLGFGTTHPANADPATSTPGLCYDQRAGTIAKCSAAGLSSSKCYVNSGNFNSDGSASWQELPCSSSVFSQGPITGSQAIPHTADKATSSCQVSGGTVNNQCGLIEKYVNPFIKFLSAVVGIAVTIGIIVGGIQYSTSAGDPQKAAKAKDHIMRAVVALVAFAFLWAFLEWLVPGGFLNG